MLILFLGDNESNLLDALSRLGDSARRPSRRLAGRESFRVISGAGSPLGPRRAAPAVFGSRVSSMDVEPSALSRCRTNASVQRVEDSRLRTKGGSRDDAVGPG